MRRSVGVRCGHLPASRPESHVCETRSPKSKHSVLRINLDSEHTINFPRVMTLMSQCVLTSTSYTASTKKKTITQLRILFISLNRDDCLALAMNITSALPEAFLSFFFFLFSLTMYQAAISRLSPPNSAQFSQRRT